MKRQRQRMPEDERIRGSLRLRILAADALGTGGIPTCMYCGERLVFGHRNSQLEATVDHVVPRSHMGPDDGSMLFEPENLLSCCRQCNVAKNGKLLGQFVNWMQESLLGGWLGTRRLPEVQEARRILAPYMGEAGDGDNGRVQG